MKIGKRNIPDDCVRPAGAACAVVTESYTITLVTPMFGGGAEAGKPDQQLPFRASSIRGHLRFWWRTLRGPFLKNPTGLEKAELIRLRETEIFGDTEVPAALEISVTDPKKVKTLAYGTDAQPFGFRAATRDSPADPRLYALFPALPNQQVPAKDLTEANATFTLTTATPGQAIWLKRVEKLKEIRQENNKKRARSGQNALPNVWEDIDTLTDEVNVAIWGWVNFGGIGARTRRGVGAIQVVDADTKFSLLTSDGCLRYPLPGCMSLFVRSANSEDAGAAWSDAVKLYRDFRQQRTNGTPKNTLKKTNGGVEVRSITPPNGRSQWPEPDSLRASAFSGASLKEPSPKPANWPIDYSVKPHDQPVDPNVTLPAFPRAILGMPINFHFADSPNKDKATEWVGIADTDCDPKGIEVLPRVDGQEKDRMASPVITRPIWNGENWRAGFLFLKSPDDLNDLEAFARGEGIPKPNGHPVISHARIAGAAMTSVKPLQGCEDAISALKKRLGANYEEVPSPAAGGN